MLDEEALASVRQAMTEVADRSRDLAVAEAGLQHAVRVLHATGGSLQEIAQVVGLSRQRVHQIVKASGGVPGRRRRNAAGLLICSFCDRNQADVVKLIAGPNVYICNWCVAAVRARLKGDGDSERCSFCGKEGRHGITLADRDGEAPRICGECLDLCDDILIEELGGS